MSDRSEGRRTFAVAGGSRVTAIARSTLHDLRATCEDVVGEGAIDPADPLSTPRLRITVRVAEFRTGSFLQDVAVRRHLDVRKHPEAVFELDQAKGSLERLSLEGRLAYRGSEVPIRAEGRLTLGTNAASGEVSFDVDLTRFGLSAPAFLVLKVDDVVRVEVKLRAKER